MVTRIALAVLIITVALKELIHKQKMESNMQHYKLVFSKKKLPIRIDKSFKKKSNFNIITPELSKGTLLYMVWVEKLD